MKKFKGDKKSSKGLLSWLDTLIRKVLLKRIPSWLKTYHLTYMTILWSGLIIFGGFMARRNLAWLWFISLMIFLQYVTDLLDGAIGRVRNTGLIKWGYYMDHFLDYVFLSAILISYAIILPKEFHLMILFVLVMFIGFMVNSYLSFSATNEFKIHYLMIGPTESRFIFIIINALLAYFGKTYLVKALPYIVIFAFLGLMIVIYRTQKKIWEIDEKNKGEKI